MDKRTLEDYLRLREVLVSQILALRFPYHPTNQERACKGLLFFEEFCTSRGISSFVQKDLDAVFHFVFTVTIDPNALPH